MSEEGQLRLSQLNHSQVHQGRIDDENYYIQGVGQMSYCSVKQKSKVIQRWISIF